MTNWKKIMADAEFKKRMQLRSEIVFGIRRFFRDRDFLEVETPTMVRYPGMEPNLNPFSADLLSHDHQQHTAHLITSPEYSCKKLLAAGYERLFEITRCYRNAEPWDGAHNPEFTMIEWYRAQQDYRAIMTDTEQLVEWLAQEFLGGAQLQHRGQTLDVSAPWDRLTVAEAFDRYTSLDLLNLLDDTERFRSLAREQGYAVAADDTFDDIFFRIFLRDIEPKLGEHKPVFLYEYPRQMASLARLKPDDSRLAERFEAYVGGLELCNAFSELNDADEQYRRLVEEQVERARLDKPRLEIDPDFIQAVGQMPTAAGIALGVDRLVMLLTDSSNIADVLFFPAQDIFK
ncbi:MAG: EF-P lysine aminoacylase EpmA [Patescibacteria group bacterium]